ncbi:MAG: 50S ribosomal protein L1 [Candidatus Bathyarchaeia archaeon]|nr:50S ribosomal protein L1 [Candidatus Bathyarchaeota archaeon]
MSVERKRLKEALKELRDKTNKRNFNQSIELIINLQDVDISKPENRIQEVIELPHPIGKKVNVCVFASGDAALRARRAGADMVLEREEIESLAGDKKRQRQIAKQIDSFIATAPMMPIVGRVFGAILGPRGKMPTPIPPTADIEREIERHRRLVMVRTRGQPVLSCRVGTENMIDDDIIDNIEAVLRRIEGKLKRGIKNIASIYIKTSMGPPIKVKLEED